MLDCKEIKREKGITLIALIITIIVLLILAGVTIAILTGENGVLRQTNEAKANTEIAEAKERAQIDLIDWQAERLKNNQDATLSDHIIQGILKENKDYVKQANTISFISIKGEYEIFYKDLYDSNGKVEEIERVIEGVTIPREFYYVGGSKEEGIVISDNHADEEKDVNEALIGNQFVWIPVNNSTEGIFNKSFKRTEGYYNGSLADVFSICGEADSTGINVKIKENQIVQEEAKEMYASVKKNGGFYIARYEAGNEGGKVVSKKGATVWNNIGWSNSDIMTNITGGAVEKARGLANQNTYTRVKSTLCYGVQWDATMNFIDANYITNEVKGKPNCNTTSYVRNGTGKGNYSETQNTNDWKGKAAPTGASIAYQIKNIYDLAGNVYEWTMESRDTNLRVGRGGNYGNTAGYDRPASIRSGSSPSFSSGGYGFRCTLYLVP